MKIRRQTTQRAGKSIRTNKIDETCVNGLRFIAIDAIETARSGHPGIALGAAPTAYTLWQCFLKFDPSDPSWFDRDRFILSAGHGSALLYALLHCYGYPLPIEEIERFRQWDSKTPGHPEYGLTPGVEVTTGPLGQGFAMAVGMAIAESFLAKHFNRPGFPMVDHYTYVLVSDGDLMEGVSHEAASLAGTLGLGKLICLYDDNDVSIEGRTSLAFTEDVAKRFTSYGWHVQSVEDANDIEATKRAIRKARTTAKPSLVIIRSHLAFGSPKQDNAEAHGAPLGKEATIATKRNLGWLLEPQFYVPPDANANFRKAILRGMAAHKRWLKLTDEYRGRYAELAHRFENAISGLLPHGWESLIPRFRPDHGPIATRHASGKILNDLAKSIDMLVGGSADLAPSTMTYLEGYGDFSRENPSGRNLRFGVREFAMAGVLNGMALHRGIIPYGSTFLVFSDYMRPALRLAAMQKAHAIFVFTHDSIAVGEDGPTHQPVEQLMGLRSIPGLAVLRPADANETSLAWRIAIQRQGPVAIVLSRQNLPILDPEKHPIEDGVKKGAYVLEEAHSMPPELILIATGSEVHIALDVSKKLIQHGISTRVISMPSWEIFDEQEECYRRQLLPPEVPKLSIEAGVTLGWERYTSPRGGQVGVDRFGASAPGKVIYEQYGFNSAEIMSSALRLARRRI